MMLSFAGRLTLVNSVLSCLPVYYLSLFRMLECIAKEFERIKAAFLLRGSDLKRKVHLVKWEEVTTSIGQGGLGIRKIRVVNSCLLFKWWWRFAEETKTLWRRVICSKYNQEKCSWLLSCAASNRLPRLWSDIILVPNFNPDLLERF